MMLRTRVILAGVLITMALAASGCAKNDVLRAEPSAHVFLDIKDRGWAPNRPNINVGWCGEASIQMAMAYYGREVPQTVINRAAGVGIPEITENNMDVALGVLGVAYVAWDDSNHDVDQFIEWIKAALRKGHPVICGMKVYTDEHPEWCVDHFVLAVGFDEDGLILNIQPEFGGQQHIDYDDLKSLDEGEDALSFQSTHHQYFARAITGLR